MGADEEGTVRDLKAHQAVVLPIISQFGGRVIDIAGDGIRRTRSLSACRGPSACR